MPSQNNPKPSTQPDVHLTTPASQPSGGVVNNGQYLDFLLEVCQSQELLNQFNIYRHSSDFDPLPARGALGSILQQLMEGPLKIIQHELAKIKTINRENGTILKSVIEEIVRIEDNLFESPAKRRFKNEFAIEKRMIANCVVDRYFGGKLDCFFQASTTAYHLAEVLSTKRSGRGSVIHTNSYSLPYLLLGKGKESLVSVYPVCGQCEDHLCDGWLYHLQDDRADNYLRSLFQLDRGPSAVKTAFITPQFVDVEGNFYFGKSETIPLVRTLLESAPNIVILTPGPRILNGPEELPGADQTNWDDVKALRSSTTNSITWIVGGQVPEKNMTELQKTCESLNSEVVLLPC